MDAAGGERADRAAEMVEATREAVASYAASLATSATELTAAFGADGSVRMATGDLALASGEQEGMASLALAKNTDYLTVDLGGCSGWGRGSGSSRSGGTCW